MPVQEIQNNVDGIQLPSAELIKYQHQFSHFQLQQPAAGSLSGARFAGQNESLSLHTLKPNSTIEILSSAHRRQKKVQQIQEELTASHSRRQVTISSTQPGESRAITFHSSLSESASDTILNPVSLTVDRSRMTESVTDLGGLDVFCDRTPRTTQSTTRDNSRLQAPIRLRHRATPLR